MSKIPPGIRKQIQVLVREKTANGLDVVQFMVGVLRGDIRATTTNRMDAARWLADYGFGKPQPVPEGSDEHKERAADLLSDLTKDQLVALALGSTSATPALPADTQAPDPTKKKKDEPPD